MTMTPLILSNILTTIHQAWSNVKAVYLFGSYANETQRADSDMDLALLFAPKDAKRVTLLNSPGQVQLESLLGVGVDLINLQTVDTVFQNEIIHQGQVVFLADDFTQCQLDEFEIGVMARYRKLNEERKEIIQSGLASGFY